MSSHAAILIDLAGFRLARAANGGRPHSDSSSDMTLLMRALRRQFGEQRVVVQRAYGDFGGGDTRHPETRAASDGQSSASELAALSRLGLEPVQVTGRSEVAMLRLSLDAVALAQGRSPGLGATRPAIDRIVLVTGAADISPLVTDLRAMGVRVYVVGVASHTLAERHAACDEFSCFEDIASPALLAEFEQETALVRGAVVEILSRRRPLPVVQLVEQVCKSVGRPLELAAGGAQSFAAFLREYETEFGIVLRRGEHEVLVADLSGDGVPTPARQGGPLHTPSEYRQLLRLRNPRVHLTARDEWLRISELFFEFAGGADPVRPIVHQQDLTGRVVRQCELENMDHPEKKAQSVVFQLFKSGAFVCAEPGAEGDSDFHWSRPARLSDGAVDLEAMRHLTRVYIARVLIERLQSEFGTPEVDPEVFAEMLEGEVRSEQQVDRIESVLDEAEDQLAIPVRD